MHYSLKPVSIAPQKKIKVTESVTSGERDELVAIINAINACGTAQPPTLIFPRVNYREHFIRGAPVGSIGAAIRSEWVNEETFLQYLKHFAHHTGCIVDRKAFFIHDNLEAVKKRLFTKTPSKIEKQTNVPLFLGVFQPNC